MREKIRVSIECPDLPEQLKESAGNLVASLWRQAQEAAQANFTAQLAEGNKNGVQSLQELENAKKEKVDIEVKLSSTQAQLEIAFHRGVESDKIHAVDISTLVCKSITAKIVRSLVRDFQMK